MNIQEILREVLQEQCPFIHNSRLNAVFDVAEGLRASQNLAIASIGRKLSGGSSAKHKIKKVDRCLSNQALYEEVHSLYAGLSYFVFKHLEFLKENCIVIDLCYLKDGHQVQMLSAQICTRGMTLPIYQQIFNEGELKDQTEIFLVKLKELIPLNKKVVVIMDAGFHVEWFKIIENYGWNWVCRIRSGRNIFIDESWKRVEDFIQEVPMKTKDYGDVLLTNNHKYQARLITTRNTPKDRKAKAKVSNDAYNKAAKEPWILATNLSNETHKSPDIIKLYSKRMQVEETFRAIKSHQFGLSARYIRTNDVKRWSVLMLLSSIVLITYWVVGVIGYNQGMEKYFQTCSNKNPKRQFSYFTLGKYIIEYGRLDKILPIDKPLSMVIEEELTGFFM